MNDCATVFSDCRITIFVIAKFQAETLPRPVPPFNAARFVYNRAVLKSARHTPKPRWTTSWPGRIGRCF